jgi:hypothetical protein
MKNRLDKFINDKMDQRSFEYQDSYWKDMEHLLDQNEMHSSRRRPGIWLLLIVLFISGSFVVYQITNYSSKTLTNYIENIDNQDIENNKNIKITNKAGGESLADNPITVSVNESKIAPRGSNFTEDESSPNQELAIREITDHVGASPNTEEKKSADFAYGKANTKVEVNVFDDSEAHLKSSMKESGVMDDKAVSSTEVNRPVEINFKDLNVEELAMLKHHINSDFKIAIPILQFNDKFEEFGTKVQRRSRINLGFQGGIVTNAELYGLTAGPVFRFDLKPNLNLQAGLHYSYMIGISPITKKTSVLEYGFRAVARDAYLKANSFHFIELPISLNYKLFRHNFGLGLDIKYLAGIRGDIANADSDSGQMMIHKNWIVTDGFNRVIPSVGLVYGYEITEKLFLQYNLSYGLIPLVDSNYEIENSIDLGMSSSLWSNLKLTYYLRK